MDSGEIIMFFGIFIISLGFIPWAMWDFTAEDVKGPCYDAHRNLINDLVCDVKEKMPTDYKIIIGLIMGFGFIIAMIGFALALKEINEGYGRL